VVVSPAHSTQPIIPPEVDAVLADLKNLMMEAA
jgi:hypothetical protein